MLLCNTLFNLSLYQGSNCSFYSNKEEEGFNVSILLFVYYISKIAFIKRKPKDLASLLLGLYFHFIPFGCAGKKRTTC